MNPQATTNKVKPIKRTVNGLLILDKPIGATSNRALQNVKRLFNAKKAGHTGSLDPLASGILPICFGEATKFSQFLLDADKIYLVRAQLGIRTETGDAEGVVVAQKEVPEILESQLESVLEKFRGDISQVPSMYSALKHQGRPLYEYARKGITIDRPARALTIYELALLEKTEAELTFRVHCSKGTYIRTLIDDIGEALGCGAHVSMLRRIGAGPFREQDMVSMEELEALDVSAQDVCLQSIEMMVMHLPQIELSASTVFYMQQGQPVMAPNLPKEGLVRIRLKNGEFVGVGEVLDDGKVAPKKLLR